MSGQYLKDPDADLDYRVDWSQWLAAGETITGSSWTVPVGITQGTGPQAPTFDSTSATIWLTGGTDGQAYPITNRVTTSAGRVDDRTITITVRQR